MLLNNYEIQEHISQNFASTGKIYNPVLNKAHHHTESKLLSKDHILSKVTVRSGLPSFWTLYIV
jgi:hypothetical protein